MEEIVIEVLNEYLAEAKADVERTTKLLERHANKPAYKEIDVSLMQDLSNQNFKVKKIETAIKLAKLCKPKPRWDEGSYQNGV